MITSVDNHPASPQEYLLANLPPNRRDNHLVSLPHSQ